MISPALALAALALGHTLSERLWSWQRGRSEVVLEPLERVCSAATLGLASALAASYALALSHVLSRWTLLATTAVFLAVSAPPILRWVQAQQGRQFRIPSGAVPVALAALPVGCFVLYVLWRTQQLFVLNHDGLAYHMPRAAMIARSGSLFAVDGPDPRVATMPANYEVLLADVLAIDGSDELSGWVSPAAFLALLLAVGAMAQRWWGRGPHVMAVVCVVAAMPVAILHAGAHKNDLMASALIVMAAHFAARWATEETLADFVLLWVTVTLAACTKITALVLVAVLVPLVVAKLVAMLRAGKRPGPAAWKVSVPLVLVSIPALGPAVYLHNLLTMGHLFGHNAPGAESGWGDFANLWRFPYMALAAPFSSNRSAVWVPWDGRYWFWPVDDLFFSTYGLLVSACALALPVGVAFFVRSPPSGRSRERLVASALLLATFLLLLPIRLRPIGFFAAFVRYTIFFPPVLALWTAAPAVRALSSLGGRARIAAAAIPGALSLYFAEQAIRLSINDTYAPFRVFAEVIVHPELRRTVWNFPNRAASVADHLAGPDDAIAFEGAYDGWSYPLFGAQLSRQVTYLHSEREDFKIPDNVRWVVID